MTPATGLLLAAALASGAAAASSGIPGRAPVVRPTGASIPENALRLSMVFAERPDGPALPRLALLDGNGTRIPEPFLEQELWSPDGRTLTVLMHPGRVKTGLAANELLGRALVAGRRVTLVLGGRTLRSWIVTAADRVPPDPQAWRTTSPRIGTREAVAVTLDAPVDAMDGGLIAIRAPDGRRVAGNGRLSDGEARWTFTPARPWRPGTYTVVAAPDLEDPAGNRPGQDFEHAPGAEAAVPDGPAFAPTARR